MKRFFLALLLLTTPTLAAEGPTRLLRFPDIHGEQVVFTYAGDLWRAPTTGGTAVRLTAHPDLELFGKFSPNDRWNMDFMEDSVARGRKIRTLNVLDEYSRECLAIEVDTALSGARGCASRINPVSVLPAEVVTFGGER